LQDKLSNPNNKGMNDSKGLLMIDPQTRQTDVISKKNELGTLA
jgi:hypothetical protein